MPQHVIQGGEEMICPRKFLEKYSLPRVARLVSQEEGQDNSLLGGDILLYTHYTSGKVGARNSSLLVIPDTYQGWLSVVTERGQIKARCYTTIQRLVQAQVTSFLTVADIPAYTLANRTSTDGRRQQYTKTTVRRGQVLRLLAVYQDMANQSSKSKRLSWPLLAKTDDRYTQCLTPNDQVVYIPVSTPGQFYCVSGGNPEDTTGRVYQMGRLLRTFPLPVRVAIINGFKTQGSLLLETYKREEVIIGCVLPKDSGQFRLLEIDMNSKLFVMRPNCRLSDERRLYQSEKVQSALRYCHENWQQWTRQMKVIHHIFPKKERKISLADKKTVKSASFRYSAPRLSRSTDSKKPSRPLPPPPEHIYSKVPDEEDVVRPSYTHVQPSFKTKIFINDTSSEISSEIVDSFFSESNYPLRQECTRRQKPLYKTRVTIGNNDLPYSTVRDDITEPSLYAEITEPRYFYNYPKYSYCETISNSSISNITMS